MNIAELPWWAWLVAYTVIGFILVLSAFWQDFTNRRKGFRIDGLEISEAIIAFVIWPLIIASYLVSITRKRIRRSRSVRP